MSERGRIRVEPSHKRIRTYLGGEVIADTTGALLVWEVPYYPTYYLPEADVRMDRLIEEGEGKRSPSRGTPITYTIEVDGSAATAAAYTYPDSPIEGIRGYIAFVWKAMDHWFEEDEEVYVHPRDPYTRVDVLNSSRNVRIEIDGVTVADSNRPALLFETGLPVRYYLPKTDVRMDLLVPTDTATECPYKGTARYWSVDTGTALHQDLVWGYSFPAAESARIAGLVSFYNEKVDIYVDGTLEDRPKTKFS